MLPTLESNSIDAIVTDPPYELGFMGKPWDASGIAYNVDMWREALRVLKPGGHVLAFGGTRTYHRMTVAIEDAGFEIRDCLQWLYGSGFPKSHNVYNAINLRAGVDLSEGEEPCPESLPWDGWGTALKPANEPIVLARKPLEARTVAANVLAWGTGAINIDGCRIGTDDNLNGGAYSNNRELSTNQVYGEYRRLQPGQYEQPSGRWPANVLLDEESAQLLDAQTGVTTSPVGGGIRQTVFGRMNDDAWQPKKTIMPGYGDTGGASRFFKVFSYSGDECKRYANIAGTNGQTGTTTTTTDPKKSAGCVESVTFENTYNNTAPGVAGSVNRFRYVAKASKRERGAGNTHPTVKPVALIQYLIRLITPPGGTVLDPFAGSGTTGLAALTGGVDCVLIEREPEYVDIINARVSQHCEH